MSANRRNVRDVLLGSHRLFDVGILWPASVGAARPKGKFRVLANVTTDEAGWNTIDLFDETNPEGDELAALQPNGDGAAGNIAVVNIEARGFLLRFEYEAESGGAGVVPRIFVYPR